MTGSCAQRRHWSRLRAWTARSIAVAGITGGAWLLGAGLATATPSTPRTHLAAVPAVAVTAPVINEVAPESGATTEATGVESGPAATGTPSVTTDTAAADVEAVHDESTSTHDAGRQLGVAGLVAGIASDVHARLAPVDEPELTDPVESSLTEPDAGTPVDQVPDTALNDLRSSDRTGPAQPPAPRVSEPVAPPPPPAEPARVESDHLAEVTGTDQAAQDHNGPAKQTRGAHWHPPTSTSHPVPPISPPAAPVATATTAPTGPGHGLRWMHAILPTQPFLPGPVRAAGGHVDTVTLRGIALIEPSASPD